MNDDMIGCSDDGDEEIIEVYEKIQVIEDEMPL